MNEVITPSRYVHKMDVPPCKDNNEAVLQQAKQVAVIWEADLADSEDAATTVVEANDVAIVTEALNAYNDIDAIVDDSNDNDAESMPQSTNLVEDLVDLEGG